MFNWNEFFISINYSSKKWWEIFTKNILVLFLISIKKFKYGMSWKLWRLLIQIFPQIRLWVWFCCWNYSYQKKVVIVKLKNMSTIGGDIYRRIRETLVAWQNKFKFNRINNLTIKVVGELQNLKILYYINLKIPIMHQQLYRKIARKEENIKKTFVLISLTHFKMLVVDGIYI